MSLTLRRLGRLAALPLFALALAGWTAGLLQVQATGSAAGLLASTACGVLALSSLVAWASLRHVPAR